MATYQDRKGKTFKTREQAKASNLAMNKPSKGGGSNANKDNLQKQVDILTQVVDLQKQLNEKKKSQGGGGYATDAEISDYARRGLTEGSMIPGRGILRPDGSFDTSSLPKSATPDSGEIPQEDEPFGTDATTEKSDYEGGTFEAGEKTLKKTKVNKSMERQLNERYGGSGSYQGMSLFDANKIAQKNSTSQRTSYVYNPETTSRTQRAIDRFGFALNEINNDPYKWKGSKESARMALLESSAKDFAKLFQSPDELFGAYNSEPDMKAAFDKYIKAGGTLNNVAKNITAPAVGAPVTDINAPAQDTASYLASINNPQADKVAQDKAFDELIPEREVMQARIMQEARIPEELRDLYFGTEEQVGIVEQKRMQAEEEKKILEREEKNEQKSLRAKAQLQIKKNNADFEITKNKIEENRLAAKNYITGYLAKLGALNTTGAAPLAIQTLDQKYQRQSSELQTSYKFANREIELGLTDAVNKVETDTDRAILEIEEDMTKDEETVAKEILKAQQASEKEIYSITEKYANQLRLRTAKFTQDAKIAAEKYAKEYLKTAAGGVDLKAIADKISTGEGEEGQYIVQGKKKGVILPDGSISSFSLTPTQQTEVESAQLRGEDAIRFFITLPKPFRDNFIQSFDGNGTVSMNRLQNAYKAYQAKIEEDKKTKEAEKKTKSTTGRSG